MQQSTDERVEPWTGKALCPARGLSVCEIRERKGAICSRCRYSWSLFDIAIIRTVRPDCTVSFENRSYPMPFEYAKEEVEVRGCSGSLQILARDRVIHQYPRNTVGRILLDAKCYEDEATDRILIRHLLICQKVSA